MTTARLVNPYQLFKDVTGEDLANGTITVYLNKTTTLANVWADADATIPQVNPYTLNGLGQVEGDLWFTDVVTILVKNSLGTTQWQVDDVNTQQDADDLLTSLVPKGGSFFYSEVIASGVVLSVGEVVRGDATGNNFRYNGGPVVNPESDTPYDQDTGLSNSGAWTDITIASAPVKESDIINLQDQINDIDPELNVDNFITGLEISNGADTANDIEISIGNCQDSTNTTRLKLLSVLTKQIDVDWQEGNNAGGFPSTLSITDDWYRFFLIGKSDGTVDAGFDTIGNSDASALLNDATGYTLYRQIGWVKVYESSPSNYRIVNFVYDSNLDLYLWDDLSLQDNSSNEICVSSITSTTFPLVRTNFSTLCPPNETARVTVRTNPDNVTPAIDIYGLVTSNDQADATPSASVSNLISRSTAGSNNNLFGTANLDLKVDSDSNIGIRFSVAGTQGLSSDVYVLTEGYIYKR